MRYEEAQLIAIKMHEAGTRYKKIAEHLKRNFSYVSRHKRRAGRALTPAAVRAMIYRCQKTEAELVTAEPELGPEPKGQTELPFVEPKPAKVETWQRNRPTVSVARSSKKPVSLKIIYDVIGDYPYFTQDQKSDIVQYIAGIYASRFSKK